MRRWWSALGVVVAFGASAAWAQTDYPGSTTSTTVGTTEEVINAGIIIEGTGFRNEACLFVTPQSVTVEFNGQLVETDNVESDGCARQDVFVDRVGPTSGADPQSASGGGVLAVAGLALTGELAQQAPQAQVALNIDGRPFAGRLQGNVLIVSGTGASGNPRRVITQFDVADRSVLGGGANGGGGGTPGTRSPLARTGAAILFWTGAGAVLVLVGIAFSRSARRRRRHLTA